MSAHRLRLLVLCEDRAQERFIRRLLERRHGRIEFEVAPRGQNAAAWVQKRYAMNLRKWIRRNPNERKGLVVVTDGDQFGVDDRMQKLADELRRASEDPRADAERVSLLIPTWSIETWFAEAQGESGVTEAVKWKVAHAPDVPDEILGLTVELFERGAEKLPSLQNARSELRRLDA